MQSAAVALFWWVEIGTTRGSRTVDYDPAKRVTHIGNRVVRNDP